MAAYQLLPHIGYCTLIAFNRQASNNHASCRAMLVNSFLRSVRVKQSLHLSITMSSTVFHNVLALHAISPAISNY